jgi:hypothetical protein
MWSRYIKRRSVISGWRPSALRTSSLPHSQPLSTHILSYLFIPLIPNVQDVPISSQIMDSSKRQDEGVFPYIYEQPWFTGDVFPFQAAQALDMTNVEPTHENPLQWSACSPFVQVESLGNTSSPEIVNPLLPFSPLGTPLLLHSPMQGPGSLSADSFLRVSGYDAPIQQSNTDVLMPSPRLPLASTNRDGQHGSTEGHPHLHTTSLLFYPSPIPIITPQSSRARSISYVGPSQLEASTR